MVLGKPAREGESPVSERQAGKAGSRVPRDTWNLVGKSGDHPVRLNTPWRPIENKYREGKVKSTSEEE